MPSVSVPATAIAGLLTSAGIGTAAGAGATAGLIGADATAALSTGLATGLEGGAVGALSSWAEGGNPLLGAGIGFGTAGLAGGLGAAFAGPAAGAASGAASGAAADAVPTAAAPAIGATTVPATAAAGAPAATASAAPAIGGTSAASAAPAAGAIVPPVDPTATGVLSSLGGTTPEQVVVTAPSTATAAPGVAAAPGVGGAAGAVGGSPAATGQTPSQPSSVQQFINNPSLGTAGHVLAQNPQAVIGALGLGYDILHQGSIPGMGQLQSFASQEEKMAQANQSYVNTGTLPAGAQAALDQATQAAKAQVRSKYASLGMSGSTAETQDLANVDISAAGEKFSIASQLLQAGASQANVSQEMLNEILGINSQQEAATTSAISNFAASLGGSGTPLYLTQKPGG